MNVKIVQFNAENASYIVDVRTQVFVEEQGIDTKLDFDGLDKVATHALVFVGGKGIGTGRILDDGHIGRIAVLKAFRQQSVGAEIVAILLSEAKKRKYKRVYLGSQIHATEFYKKLGFKTCGDVFMDAGLEHIEMEMFLG